MKQSKVVLICHLFTSYYSGRLWPNQMQHPPSTANIRRKEIINENSTPGKKSDKIEKKYVPMSHAAFLETQSDYLSTTGNLQLAEKAVEKVGIALAASHAQQGDYSNQTLRLYVKLMRSLRIARKFEQALRCGLKALYIMRDEEFCHLHLENYMEARLELAQLLIMEKDKQLHQNFDTALEDLRVKTSSKKHLDPDVLFDEIISTFENSHDLGNSERYTRLIPRTRRMNQQGFDAKWIHYSPYDTDRCFALMDTVLDVAEQYYQNIGKLEKQEVVLFKRTQYMDSKDFNRRIYAGRIETMRGRVLHRNTRLTTLPPPQELLTYYPTVHQTYMNYRYCLTAPEDKEHEVWPGVNRCVQDGDPLRRQTKFYRIREARRHGHKNEMQNLQYR